MTNEPDSLQRFLPLSPTSLELLLSIADAPKHGYAIMKEISESTDGRVELSAGTLYGLIRRLGDRGLIRESQERPPRHWDDQRRRYYELTDLGRRVVGAELLRLERVLAHGRHANLQPTEG